MLSYDFLVVYLTLKAEILKEIPTIIIIGRETNHSDSMPFNTGLPISNLHFWIEEFDKMDIGWSYESDFFFMKLNVQFDFVKIYNIHWKTHSNKFIQIHKKSVWYGWPCIKYQFPNWYNNQYNTPVFIFMGSHLL